MRFYIDLVLLLHIIHAIYIIKGINNFTLSSHNKLSAQRQLLYEILLLLYNNTVGMIL